MASAQFTVALTSDLHAYSSVPAGERKPSHLCISSTEEPENHPIVGLLELIQTQSISADVLLCAGDLGHQACPEAIKYAWNALFQVKAALNAGELIATVGNHDLDSRFIHNVNPIQTLQDLAPEFPYRDTTKANQYWSRTYTVVPVGPAVVVTLNSSATHGYQEQEKNHGRVTPAALSALRKIIEELRNVPIKILLCHHHPHQHDELNLGPDDVMADGQRLLDLLSKDTSGTWLVVHGHKHHPKISYAAGGSNAPVVLASGSLCSALFLELQTEARNQFHTVTFDLDTISRLGLVGRVRSWYWHCGTGWETSHRGTGLPYECGFGHRGRPTSMADAIRDEIKNDLRAWNTIASKIESVNYMLPQDFDYMRSYLHERHKIKITDDERGQPFEVSEVV